MKPPAPAAAPPPAAPPIPAAPPPSPPAPARALEPELEAEPEIEVEAAPLESPLPPADAAGGSLFDLDLPASGDRVSGRAPAATSSAPSPEPAPEPEPESDVMSLQIPLEGEPDLARMSLTPSAGEPEPSGMSVPPASLRPSMALVDREGLRSLVPPADKPRTELEQRRARGIERVVTLRDALRLLGQLDQNEDERKAVVRALMELDGELAPALGHSVVKEPNAALAAATTAQLDTLERLIGPAEEKLLALDDLIGREVFQSRVQAPKQSKKLVARYGRLLGSRRMPAGERRDRFEWIATHLLTASLEGGKQAVLPPDRARPVLQHLVGGIGRKIKAQELDDAVAFLYDAIGKLEQLKSADELFATGLYLDVLGYKVSMREQLMSPEFLYLSVAFNARLTNQIETWLSQESASVRVSADGSARDRLMRRLRDQQDEVDFTFGVRRRSAVHGSAKATQGAAKATAQTEEPARSLKSPRPAAAPEAPAGPSGTRTFMFALAFVIAAAAAVYAMHQHGLLKLWL